MWFRFERNDLADSLDFDMNLKTNPIGMIQIINQNWLDFSKIELDFEFFFCVIID